MSEGGVAIAALTERIKEQTKKYRLINALKLDISIRRVTAPKPGLKMITALPG
jgi:hypothetical protein